MRVFTAALAAVVFGLAAPSLAEPRMGAIDVFNGAEPAVSVLLVAPCDTPAATTNLLHNGETIATGHQRTFSLASRCWIVSLAGGRAAARYEMRAGQTEHYTLMES
jgi:hypothetical protein